MVALLMLGIVPGTNIQIDFGSWLSGIAVLVVLMIVYLARRKRLFAHLMILLAFYVATRHIKVLPQA